MRIEDFIIHSTGKLDRILAECCRQVLEKHDVDPEYWGMVGACVLGTDGRIAWGVNHMLQDGLRDHAEVVAIKNYTSKYGSDSLDGTIIITTLSPCSTDIDQPGGRNCVDYINRHGIKKVWCGWSDAGQVDTDTYKSKHFHVAETRNPKLRTLCQKMAETFLDKQ